MSLGLPEIGTGSNYFSQYDSDIQALLSRIYDNNSNVILAKDVRDPIWTLWNRIQQIGSQSLTQSSLYTLGTPSTISVGGIPEGSTFSNATLNQLFDTLLLPYVSPVIDIFSSSVTEIQFGNPAPSTLSYSINVGSVPLQSVNFVGPWLPIVSNAPTGLDPDTGTKAVNLTYSTAVAITQTNRFTMSVVTTDLLSFTSSVDVTFKHKRYYGKLTIPGGFTASDPASVLSVASYLTDTRIKGLSFSELSTNVNFSQAVDFNNEYFIFAAPTIFGFNYPVGFYVDNIFTQDFTKIRSNSAFINEYSYSAPYDVYISNNIFYEPSLISTIPLPQGYLTSNFNNVINSVIIGDQGPTGSQGPTGPGINPAGITYSFQINSGYGTLDSFGLLSSVCSVLLNKQYTQPPLNYCRNISIGYNSMEGDPTADDIVAIGYGTLATASSHSNSVIIGNYSGSLLKSGTGNVFVGFLAGGGSTASTNNTFIGADAGQYNSKCDNTFVGFSAGRYNTGISNVFIGTEAGFTSSSSSCNVLIGCRSGYSNTTGSCNTFVGNGSGLNNTTGGGNTFLGFFAGYCNTTCSNNTYIGNFSGRCSSGSSLVFVGLNTGCKNQGSFNTFIGSNSGLNNTTGNNNTFIGNNTGLLNTTGGQNTYIGDGAGGNSNIANTDNILVGYRTGNSIFGQSNCNILIGNGSGFGASSSCQNIFIGHRTGECILGSCNLIMGINSAISQSNLCKVTFIGNYIDASTPGTYSHSIAIGNGTLISKDNQLSIASSTSPISTGTTASTCGANVVPSTASAFLCVTINGTDYKLPLFI